MSLVQAILMAVLQGVTELFPVSSLGHSVLLSGLLSWQVLQSDAFIPILVMLHLGTAVALIIYFWSDWVTLFVAFFSGGSARRADRRVAWMLIWGTLPAVVIVLLFEKRIRAAFTSAWVAAGFLAINGLLLLIGERMRRRAGRRKLDSLGPADAIGVGLAQALALIPGISRSGVTLVGGLLIGLSYEAAARFSFLLATPIILGAGVHEVGKLLKPEARELLSTALVGGVVAGVAAYASIAFLMRYFKRKEIDALAPFGYYCLVVGVAALAWLGLMR